MGYAGLVWLVAAAALALRTRRSVLNLTLATAATVWFADLIALVIKRAAERPRPFEVLADADPLMRATVGASFPSGHATTAAAGAVFLAVVVRRAIPALAALALLIAFSRIYVGVHYPLDVAAGLALGAVVGLAAALLLLRAPPTPSRALRRSGAVPPRG